MRGLGGGWEEWVARGEVNTAELRMRCISDGSNPSFVCIILSNKIFDTKYFVVIA
jgi:hypothetical protein